MCQNLTFLVDANCALSKSPEKAMFLPEGTYLGLRKIKMFHMLAKKPLHGMDAPIKELFILKRMEVDVRQQHVFCRIC